MKVLQIGSIIVATTIAAVFSDREEPECQGECGGRGRNQFGGAEFFRALCRPGTLPRMRLTSLPEEEASADTPENAPNKIGGLFLGGCSDDYLAA